MGGVEIKESVLPDNDSANDFLGLGMKSANLGLLSNDKAPGGLFDKPDPPAKNEEDEKPTKKKLAMPV